MDEEKKEYEHHHEHGSSEHSHEHHHHHHHEHSSSEHHHSSEHRHSSSGHHHSSGEHHHSSGEHHHSSGEHSHHHHHHSHEHHSSEIENEQSRDVNIKKYDSVVAEGTIINKKWKKKKKKLSAGIKALIAVVLVLLILFGGIAIFINLYLSKINYDNGKNNAINPSDAVDDLPDFSERAKADADIADNLNDNIMWYDSKVYNIILAGVDYGDEGTGHYPRSDSMILLSINSYKNVINMVSLSRAAYVAIPQYMNTRLNMAHYFGGPALMVETIQKNYKIRVDKYITVNFAGFEKLIDSIGGVTIEMTEAEASKILNKSRAGSYQLDGKTALSYARERHLDDDRTRTGRQRKLLNAISDKFRNASFSTMTNMLDTILPLVTTNMSKPEIISQIVKVPQYLTMPINEDIIPHNPMEMTVEGVFEVLLINWEESNAYLHRLLYPDITPESHK